VRPLIVGGGPAGAAAAAVLAANGVRPLVLERARETADALCGGFLSWRTLERLAALGVAADALNPARVVRATVFAGSGRPAHAPLPAPALAVSRRQLDALLLAAAERAGAAVERGVGARAVEGNAVRLADGAVLAADALFLATGKHDLRGLARPAGAAGADPALGLRVRLALPRRLAAPDAIELHLFDRGYAGLVVQEDGTANLCMAVRRSRLREAGGVPDLLLAALAGEAPALAERLAYRIGAADAISNVPYGWQAAVGVPGLFRLGDQAAVIPSLAGEGMGIAVASGASAARAWLRAGPAAAPDWQRDFAAAARGPVARAGRLRDAAETALGRRLLLWAVRLGGLGMAARLTRLGGAQVAPRDFADLLPIDPPLAGARAAA